MRFVVLAALLFAVPAHAESELYLDAGLGYMWGPPTMVEGRRPASWDDHGERKLTSPDGLYALVEAGYRMGDISLFASHASSLSTGRDTGVNFVGVKYELSVRAP